MKFRPPEFDAVAKQLEPLLVGLPAKVLAVGGEMGCGKTTFGRFLAWYFNVTLIETDHYLVPRQRLKYQSEEVRRIVTERLAAPLPVIVEGVEVLALLAEIGHPPDALVHVRNTSGAGAYRSTPAKASKAPGVLYPVYELTVSH